MSKLPKISLHISAISPEKHEDKVDFLHAEKHETFLEDDSITLGVLTKNTQNKKFTISLQYLKENVKDEVDFLPADEGQKFLKIDTIILDVCCQACRNYPK